MSWVERRLAIALYRTRIVLHLADIRERCTTCAHFLHTEVRVELANLLHRKYVRIEVGIDASNKDSTGPFLTRVCTSLQLRSF